MLGALRAHPLGTAARRGRTRTVSSRKPGVIRRSSASISASANRMRAAQAEDSAMTVILPLSRVHRFTLFASPGPSALITATCHSDDSGAKRARSARAGRRAENQGSGRRGFRARADGLLVSGGSFGHSFAPAGPTVLPVQNSHRERTLRMPARCKSLKYKEQGRSDPLCPVVAEPAR